MRRVKSQAQLGLRWLTCGWRLFARNPALLLGMGSLGVVAIGVLSFIPFLGRPLVALVAPLLLASAYLTLDMLVRQKHLKPSAQKPGLRQSPHEFLNVLRDEKCLVPAVVAGFYSMLIALLANIAFAAIAGRAWDIAWSQMRVSEIASVFAGAGAALFICFWLALSLVYALPLTFFHKRPLIPALGASIKAGAQHGYALAVVLACLCAPLVLNFVIGSVSRPLAVFIAALLAVVVLPVVACSLYCSYRTLFPTQPARAPVVQFRASGGGLRWGNGNSPRK